MRIAVEGCAHGELEKIYDTIGEIEKQHGYKVDLLLCCGDFQSTRNYNDLNCMAVPKKFQDIGSFYKYYNGEKVAPILTIFIGGNHEASNYLQELPYGGWVAPNIYYLGLAGCVTVNGIRIGGLSGIFKGRDYQKGHHEIPPYNDETLRSVYHIRNLEVFRLKQMTGNVEIFLSHEWPRGVCYHGNTEQLVRYKRHFRDDINSNTLGNGPCEELLHQIQPDYWFAAHLHCKFAAIVPHKTKKTKFLALDKCLPHRRFLQILDLPNRNNAGEDIRLSYDLEWLTILSLTNHLLSVSSARVYLPNHIGDSNERYNFQPTEDEMENIRKLFGNLVIPKNFAHHDEVPQCNDTTPQSSTQPTHVFNQQTIQFCDKLQIDDPVQLVVALNPQRFHGTCLSGPITRIMRTVDMTKSVPIKMPPMACVLPKPKWINTQNPDEVDVKSSDDDDDGKGHDVEEEDVDCSMHVGVNESTLLSASGVSNIDEMCEMNAVKHGSNFPVLANEPPKKFKRRNQEIYAASQDE